MKIEKGKKYKCIARLPKGEYGDYGFLPGNIYLSEKDNSLLNSVRFNVHVDETLATMCFVEWDGKDDAKIRVPLGGLDGYKDCFMEIKKSDLGIETEQCQDEQCRSVDDSCDDKRLDYDVHCVGHDLQDMAFSVRYDESENTEKVNHPKHYNQCGIEVLDIIKAFYGGEAYEDFCAGNVVKYILRYRHKDNMLDDLKKARFYLDEIINLHN